MGSRLHLLTYLRLQASAGYLNYDLASRERGWASPADAGILRSGGPRPRPARPAVLLPLPGGALAAHRSTVARALRAVVAAGALTLGALLAVHARERP